MKALTANYKILFYSLLTIVIAWQGVPLFKVKPRLPWHKAKTLEQIIAEEAHNKNTPEEMFKLGYLLYIKGQYHDADLILRCIATKSSKESAWLNWKIRAQQILLSDNLQSFYTNRSEVVGTYSITSEDRQLFDKETVITKYGQPNEIIKLTNGLYDEKWIYRHGDSIVMTCIFGKNELMHLIIPGGEHIYKWGSIGGGE
ncbi:MAG: hypothetical protein HYV35_09665 [Lentisphaerae bacterium]|nr:hypothetical protein [Lentisphaerota bacterium]